MRRLKQSGWLTLCIAILAILCSASGCVASKHAKGAFPAPELPAMNADDEDHVVEQVEARTLEAMVQADTQAGVRRIWYDAEGRVTGVWLHHATANDQTLRMLKQFPTIQRIKIYCAPGNTRITEKGLASIVRLPQLKEIELLNAVEVFSTGISNTLGRIASLEVVRIHFSGIEKDALGGLAALPKLRSFAFTDSVSFGVTLQPTAMFGACQALRDLSACDK